VGVAGVLLLVVLAFFAIRATAGTDTNLGRALVWLLLLAAFWGALYAAYASDPNTETAGVVVTFAVFVASPALGVLIMACKGGSALAGLLPSGARPLLPTTTPTRLPSRTPPGLRRAADDPRHRIP
jgi:hypothetical protein